MASAAEERNEVAARTAGAASSPEHVRCVLLNYLLHHGHLHTAAAFLRTRVPTHGSPLDSAMEMDTDGVAAHEAHSSTASLEADRAVLAEAGVHADQFDRIEIRRRDVREALALCHEHFPGVVGDGTKSKVPERTSMVSDEDHSDTPHPDAERAVPAHPVSLDPEHIFLNLQIQMFVEAVRRAAATDKRPAGEAAAGSTELSPALQQALSQLQSLFARVQMIGDYSRSMYLAELEQVSALLVYTDLENSPVRSYLDYSRREALANQVNSAILAREGLPTQSVLETVVKQTSYTWGALHDRRVQVPADHPLFAGDAEGGSFSHLSPPSSAGNGTSGSASGSWQPSLLGDSPPPSAAARGIKSRRGRVLPAWDLHAFLEEL